MLFFISFSSSVSCLIVHHSFEIASQENADNLIEDLPVSNLEKCSVCSSRTYCYSFFFNAYWPMQQELIVF
jgi:hypothetical protein